MKNLLFATYILSLFIFSIGCEGNQSSPYSKTQNYFSLDDGNQEELILYSEISNEDLDSIQKKYSWDDYNKYDNRLWE